MENIRPTNMAKALLLMDESIFETHDKNLVANLLNLATTDFKLLIEMYDIDEAYLKIDIEKSTVQVYVDSDFRIKVKTFQSHTIAEAINVGIYYNLPLSLVAIEYGLQQVERKYGKVE